MTIGSGIAIAGAFLGTALAFFAAPDVGGGIFVAPVVVGWLVADSCSGDKG